MRGLVYLGPFPQAFTPLIWLEPTSATICVRRWGFADCVKLPREILAQVPKTMTEREFLVRCFDERFGRSWQRFLDRVYGDDE